MLFCKSITYNDLNKQIVLPKLWILSFYITISEKIDPGPEIFSNLFMIVHKLDENKPLCFSDQVADQVVVAMYHISQAYSKLHIQSHACHPSEK